MNSWGRMIKQMVHPASKHMLNVASGMFVDNNYLPKISRSYHKFKYEIIQFNSLTKSFTINNGETVFKDVIATREVDNEINCYEILKSDTIYVLNINSILIANMKFKIHSNVVKVIYSTKRNPVSIMILDQCHPYLKLESTHCSISLENKYLPGMLSMPMNTTYNRFLEGYIVHHQAYLDYTNHDGYYVDEDYYNSIEFPEGTPIICENGVFDDYPVTLTRHDRQNIHCPGKIVIDKLPANDVKLTHHCDKLEVISSLLDKIIMIPIGIDITRGNQSFGKSKYDYNDYIIPAPLLMYRVERV